MNKDLDYMGTSTNLRMNVTNQLEMFLMKMDLLDIWRKRNPMLKQFTFKLGKLHHWFKVV